MSLADINDLPNWEIYDKGQGGAKGPYSITRLIQMRDAGQITPQTAARHTGSPMWRTVEEVVQDPKRFSSATAYGAAASPAPTSGYAPRDPYAGVNASSSSGSGATGAGSGAGSSGGGYAPRIPSGPSSPPSPPPTPSPSVASGGTYTPGVRGSGSYGATMPPPPPTPAYPYPTAPRSGGGSGVGSFLSKAFGLVLRFPRLAMLAFALVMMAYTKVTSDRADERRARNSQPYSPSSSYSPSGYAPSGYTPSSYTPTPPKLVPIPRPKYVRPPFTPQGRAWPTTTGYLPGCPVLADGSECQIIIDNTRGGSDVHMKLSTAGSRVVRECFIRQGEKMDLDELLPGTYTVSYRDLSSGGLARADPFALERTQEGSNTYFTTMTLTLYTVVGGNTELEPISEAEF